MFERFFERTYPNFPNWKDAWCYATMLRTLHYANASQFTTWKNWAGAPNMQHFPPVGNLRSNQVIMNNDRSAIVFFEGTRNVVQLFAQLMSSRSTHDSISDKNVHFFFLWALNQEYAALMAYLNAIPALEKIIVAGHSLGGAMGTLFAERILKLGLWDVRAVYTFGQPRTFVSHLPFTTALRYFRIINDTDPIPGVPPPKVACSAYDLLAANLSPLWSFRHSQKAWIMSPGGNVEFRDNLFANELLPQIPGWFLSPGEWEDRIQLNHIVRVYVDNCRRVVGNDANHADFEPIRSLNAQIDVIEFPTGAPTLPLTGVPTAGTFAHRDTVLPPPPGTPTPAPGTAGTTIEHRSFSHTLFLFGGQDTMAKLYRSRDRRILMGLQKFIGAAQLRDGRVANPKKTSTLSNRILMFPPGGEDPLEDALSRVGLWVENLLSQQT